MMKKVLVTTLVLVLGCVIQSRAATGIQVLLDTAGNKWSSGSDPAPVTASYGKNWCTVKVGKGVSIQNDRRERFAQSLTKFFMKGRVLAKLVDQCIANIVQGDWEYGTYGAELVQKPKKPGLLSCLPFVGSRGWQRIEPESARSLKVK